MSANAVDCYDLNSEISHRDCRSHQMQDPDISVIARVVANKRKCDDKTSRCIVMHGTGGQCKKIMRVPEFTLDIYI